jgi:hypothetical protein
VRFRIEQHFGLPLDAVERTLCDPAFVEAMAQLPKLGRPQLLAHEENGETVHMQVRYAFVGHLSSAVRRVVDPQQLTWVQDLTVDRRSHRSRFRILPDHYAGLLSCEGTFALSEDGGGGSTRVAEGEVRVTVPLVGGKVERAIISGLEEHAAAEAELVDELNAANG